MKEAGRETSRRSASGVLNRLGTLPARQEPEPSGAAQLPALTEGRQTSNCLAPSQMVSHGGRGTAGRLAARSGLGN